MQEPVDLAQEYGALLASARLELEAEGLESEPTVPPKTIMLAMRCAESTDYPVKIIVRRHCTR